MDQPRVVRAAHLSLRATGRSPKDYSPPGRAGIIEADLTLRTPLGIVSRTITIRAGQYNVHGDTDVTIAVPRGFAVTVVEAGGGHSINIMPTNEA